MNFTTLYFPQSLTNLYGNTFSGGNSDYAFGPGFINFKGGDPITYAGSGQTFRAWVTANAVKGTNSLTLSTVAGLSPGLRVRVTASDPPSGKAQLIQPSVLGIKKDLGKQLCAGRLLLPQAERQKGGQTLRAYVKARGPYLFTRLADYDLAQAFWLQKV